MAELPLGLLGFAAGALQSSGPSRMPIGFGQAMGNALQGGLQNYGLLSQVEGQKTQNQMRQMQFVQQMAEQKRRAEREATQAEYLDQYAANLPPEQQALARLAPDALIKAQVENQFRMPEPPEDRKREVGNLIITEEWNPQTLGWTKVGEAPRWNPNPSPLTTIHMPKGEEAYAVERGKQFATMAGEIQAGGITAEEQLAALGPLMTSLANEDVYTGAGGNLIAGLKKGGQTLFGLDFEGVGDAEVAQTLGNQMALSLRTLMPGVMTDADRAFLQSLPPNLSNSAAGNVLVGEFYRRSAERNLERAAMARDYEARTGRIDAGFERAWAEYARNNPVFDETDYAALQEVARGTPQPTPLAGTPPDIVGSLRDLGVIQ